MADLIGNPNIAAGVQVPNQMSLGDMVQLARGMQAYRQAEQLNPLAAQKAQMEVEQLQKLNPLAARKAAAEATTAEIGAQKEQLALDQSHYNLAGNILAGLESRAQALAKKGDRETALKELNLAEQWMNTSGVPSKPDGPIATAKKALEAGDFNGYLASLENMRNMQAGASNRFQANLPQTKTVNGIDYMFNAANNRWEQITLPGANQPAGQGAGQGGGQAKPQGAPAETPAPTLFQIDKPRAPGQFSQQEKDRYDSGRDDWSAAGERAQLAADSSLATSQIRRSLSATAGSKAGQVIRSAGKAFFGNPDLDNLVKNLAEQQVRQAKLMGLSSVAAESDLKKANGHEDMTAEALAHIVERADAMNMAAQKYNKALKLMQDKYGKDATYLNNDNFKKAWSDAYDPVNFIIQSVNQSNRTPEQKEEIIKYYLEKKSDQEISDLAKKQKTLKRLERGDF
jgi:hypothetical protein